MLLVLFDLSSYPFLVDLDGFLEKEGLPKNIEDLLASAYADAGYRRVVEDLDPSGPRGSLETNDYRERILSFYIALALVSMTNDRRIYRAFAEAEAERVSMHHLNTRSREIIAVMRMLGYRVEEASEKELCSAIGFDGIYIKTKCYSYKIPLADYLRIASQAGLGDEHSLVNRPVSRGYVYIESREALAKLCEAIVRHRIEAMIRPITPIEAASKYLEGIRSIARKRFGEPGTEASDRGEQLSREKYLWIERIASKGLPDGRKRFILYVLTPYLATILKLDDDEVMRIVREFIDNSCRNYGKCEKIYDSWVRSCLRGARQKGIRPARIENLEEELRKAIESVISQEN